MVLRTFGQVLDLNRGVGPGFDFLRVFLAISIVLFHSLAVTGQYGNLDGTSFWIVHYCLVPMFFCLSGFLISASAMRLQLGDFLINRVIRIVPGLTVDTIVCALVIGPLFTIKPIVDYFLNWQFVTYFLNIVGYVHFNLPGVFDNYPTGRVNGALWTVPFEIACYALMSGLIILGWVRRRLPIVCLLMIYLLTAVAVDKLHIVSALGHQSLAKLVDVAFIQHEAQAVTGFVVGIVFYQYRNQIPYALGLLAFSLACLLFCAFSMDYAQGQVPMMRLLLMPALGYVTIFVGLTPMYLPKYFRTGDYSYGIYLYHMPLLQVTMALVPALAFSRPFGFAFTFLLGMPLVLAVAYLSWRFVEKPFLALRKRYSITARLHASSPIRSPVRREGRPHAGVLRSLARAHSRAPKI